MGSLKRSIKRRGGQTRYKPNPQLIEKLAELRAIVKSATLEAKALEAEIRAEMADAGRCVAYDWIVTAKTNKRGARPLRIKRLEK